MFCEEIRFNVFIVDRRNCVYSRREDKYTDVCIVQYNRYGGESVNVWGGVFLSLSSTLHHPLMFSESVVPLKSTLNNDSDLSMWLSSRATKIWGSLIKNDSDRPHTASVTNNFLAHQPFLWLDGLTCKFS